MSSSPEPGRGVLRGPDAGAATPARLDVDLRRSRFIRSGHADPRLADPSLDRAFEAVAGEVGRSARAAGYAAGWAQGVAAATAQVLADASAAEARRQIAERERAGAVARAVRAVEAAASALERRAVVPAEQLREAALEAALALAEAVLGHEAAVSASPGLDAVRRALDLLPRDRPVVVRLHRDDHAALGALAATPDGRAVTLVPDPAVERGGSIAECDATRVDTQFRSALSRVRDVLAP